MSAFNLKSFTAEMVGTFVLVMFGGAAAIVGSGSGSLLASALAFGSVLTVLVLFYGRVSGGHFNPAVTFGMALNGTLKWGQAAFYWLAQFLGALLGGFLLNFVLTALNASIRGAATVGVLTDLASATAQTHSLALLIEALLTFLLVTAYLRTGQGADRGARAPGSSARSWPSSSWPAARSPVVRSTRPAPSELPCRSRSLPPITARSTSPFTYVVYFFGPLIGATLAVLLNNFFEGSDEEETDDMEPEAVKDPGESVGE